MKKETIITIIGFCLLTIAVLSAIKLIYLNYKEERILLNGRVLCAQLMSAAITHYKNTSEYLETDKISNCDEYLDARTNPYFSLYSIYSVDENTQGISVFGIIDGVEYELKTIFNKNSEPVPLKNIKIKVIQHKK